MFLSIDMQASWISSVFAPVIFVPFLSMYVFVTNREKKNHTIIPKIMLLNETPCGCVKVQWEKKSTEQSRFNQIEAPCKNQLIAFLLNVKARWNSGQLFHPWPDLLIFWIKLNQNCLRILKCNEGEQFNVIIIRLH